MADQSDELALKIGRKALAASRAKSATKTLTRGDFAVSRIKLRLPIGNFAAGTFATAATGDPIEINVDSNDQGIADSD